MSVIKIDLSPTGEFILLSGETDKLLASRRARFYISDLGGLVSEGSIKIPYEQERLERILERVRTILSGFSIDEQLSQSTEQRLFYFLAEEKRFAEFARLAYSIREGQLSAKDKQDLESLAKLINASFPERQLYPLQLLSAYHLAFSQNACNFSVPGAGKTSIVYAAYAYLKSLPVDNLRHVERLVIIGPLSSFGPWEQEYRACFGHTPSSKRLSGGTSLEDRTRYLYSSAPAEIALISYQGLAGMVDHLENYLKKHPSMVVLDEAHKIKNVEGGVIATSALRMAKFARSRVVLTGTPAPNGYEDLLNLFRFIWPTKDVISFHEFQLKDMSKNFRDPRVRKLIEDIKPYFIRIKKKDLGLPTPINNPPIIVGMGEAQNEIYSFIEKKYMEFFRSQGRPTAFQSVFARARLVRLMQASTNPALLKRPLDEYYEVEGAGDNIFIDDTEIINKILKYSNLETPAKFVRAADLVEQLVAAGEKVVVWMTFVQNIKDFANYLDQRGVASKSIWGEVPVDQDDLPEDIETREQIISEFHDPNSRFKVLIANSFAISESISLHKACHNAIYVERSFNAGNFIQSKDRIHRYGLTQSDKTNYYYLLSDNNTDLTIHQRLNFKEARMMEIMEKEEIPLFHLLDEDTSDDDLRTLISNYAARSI